MSGRLEALNSSEVAHLVIVGRVDEVPACLMVCIKQLEARLFAHASHHSLPCVAYGHGTKLQRRTSYTSGGRKLTEAAQFSIGLWWGCEERHLENLLFDLYYVSV